MEISSVSIGCDHAGYPFKNDLIEVVRKMGLPVQDYGTHSEDSVDYPDFVHPVARQVDGDPSARGILICGSANGVAITANKYRRVRAAVCWKKELAALARQHNDANIICVPARFMELEEAKEMVSDFLRAEFEGGRHQRRVDKIAGGISIA